ncbi:MAG: CHAT domain-containing protein [Desulfovibrio sp.]|uniref:CHAT domain-containing protein n=1 Tax=Desulfovibrio sp. TaxID=885 RepID=UPI002590E160|nr:CHAT domain-containing protein [Desulfovibrio sp.]MCD7984540.1 CHAT domain-containing protein [Desulfovibrio sp.]
MSAAIGDFQAALTNPASDPRPAGRKLYNAIIAPIEKDLQAAGAKTLMFSLDGALRYIPMSALYDGKQWLVEKYDIVMFTEAARKSLLQDSSGGGTVAAMGVTKALAGFSALPAVAKEIDGIVRGKSGAGVLPGTTYLDGQFTRKTLADSLKKGIPLVHVASHFQFEPSDQKASFLLLGDGKRLTMGEMFGQKGFSFDKVDLLTLSACDTASGVKKGDGREVESFGALAQRRGAKAVLASLWPVADASTAAFMQDFYALHGVEKRNKAASLAETQRAMLSGRLTPVSATSPRSQRGKVSISEHDAGPKSGQASPQTASGWTHPYFWAPFVLMGNWQ